jgi:alkanesulfonate monooxygenase SsuD/methylene tetrahydromethanopterin reductase-like flavin-dependent oxidoreductase (luciferase family)
VGLTRRLTAKRRTRFAEALEMIVQAWTKERVTHTGRFFKVDNLCVVPKPVQQPYPPIRAAANSVETFEHMGRMGHPILVATPTNPFPKLRQTLPIYRQARKKNGHPDNGGEDVTLAFALYVGESCDQTRRIMEPSYYGLHLSVGG